MASLATVMAPSRERLSFVNSDSRYFGIGRKTEGF